MESILLPLACGLRNAGLERTKRALGDRSTYVGMSDIGRASDCLRAAVLGKLRDADHTRNHNQIMPENLIYSLNRELRLQRGHWFEEGLARAFLLSGKPHIHQLAIKTRHSKTPILAHLDFVFPHLTDPPHVQVVECKSAATIPETVHAAHELQLFGQIGMLQTLWNTPSFAAGNSSGPYMTFPELALQTKGVSLSAKIDNVIIEGFILTVSMNECRVSGPYTPNAIMTEMAFTLAGQIWTAADEIRSGVKTADDLPIAKGFHPLCDWCEFNADCPRFEGITAPQMELELEHLDHLKQEKALAENRIRQAETVCKALFSAASPQGDWVSANTRRFRVAICEGKNILDADRLRSELVREMGEQEAETVLSRAYRTGKPYERLLVSPINP